MKKTIEIQIWHITSLFYLCKYVKRWNQELDTWQQQCLWTTNCGTYGRKFCKCDTLLLQNLYWTTPHVLRYNYSSKSLKCACFMRRYATFWGTFRLSRKTGSTTIRLLSRQTLLEGIPGIIFTRVLGNFSTPMSHLHNLSAHIIITKKIIVSNICT